MRTLTENYDHMREMFLNGYITSEAWGAYCTTVLYQLLSEEENREILNRLKRSPAPVAVALEEE